MTAKDSPIQATRPDLSASVLASAGTGKTWMLVTRIVRLLLEGHEPGGILAITFTRKAATEMQTRLQQRLEQYLVCSDEELAAELQAAGMSPGPETLQRARNLLEELLLSEHTIRTSTFHGFCQEILTRFPLEAGISADFELVTESGFLFDQAWQSLYNEATRKPDSGLSNQLDVLLGNMTGIQQVQDALKQFIDNRNEWWAYTQGEARPADYASDRLGELLNQPAAESHAILKTTFNANLVADLGRFVRLLQKHPIKSNVEFCELAEIALTESADIEKRYQSFKSIFMTGTGEPRKRSANKTLESKLGAAGLSDYLDLHRQMCELILETEQQLMHTLIYQTSSAWYYCGNRLLDYFQSIKRDQGLMDFTDLEWHAYRLLAQSDHAQWIQYKLDQKIDHLLIDEFQDTNPVQWNMLNPLLDEMQYRENDRDCSLFIVGDEKQSIYRFRRAEPRLLKFASDRLHRDFDSITTSMNTSWRSSPAIIEAVNHVFSGNPLINFEEHGTHNTDMWGQVEVWPPHTALTGKTDADSTSLRNPLLTPAEDKPDPASRLEADAIACKIRELIDRKTPVQTGTGSRPLDYSDIFILLRSRTHIVNFEKAFQAQQIPYISSGRGTLLDSLEIRDMEALLRFLITPYNNLELAQLLKSPLFGCQDSDLFMLAGQTDQGNWFERLGYLAAQDLASPALSEAHNRLRDWMHAAGKIPVHDLLDRIYHEGQVIQRYMAATPVSRRPAIPANLGRFIELALEVDAGRYPSLTRFLFRLKSLRTHTSDAPDEPPQGENLARVQILTIHASKGLEAPVVFLADSARNAKGPHSWQCITNWEPDRICPDYFFLGKTNLVDDPLLGGILQSQERHQAVEDANLLYVAMTRARQYLFITGSAKKEDAATFWLKEIRQRLAECGTDMVDGRYTITAGEPPLPTETISPDLQTPADTPDDSAVFKPAHSVTHEALLPSQETAQGQPTYSDTRGREKGIVIHKILEMLTGGVALDKSTILHHIASRHAHGLENGLLESLYQQALKVIELPELAAIYNPDQFECAWNEISIQYLLGNRPVTGIIDRLVKGENIIVVDYKNHSGLEQAAIDELASRYEEQMNLYIQGVQKIWPDTKVSGLLVFTSSLETRVIEPG